MPSADSTAFSSNHSSLRPTTARSTRSTDKSNKSSGYTDATSYPSRSTRTVTRSREAKNRAARSEFIPTDATLTRAFSTLYKHSDASSLVDNWGRHPKGKTNKKDLWRDIGRITRQYSSLYPEDTAAPTTTASFEDSLASFRSGWEGASKSGSAITDFNSHMTSVRGMKAALASSHKAYQEGLRAKKQKQRARVGSKSTAGRSSRSGVSTTARSKA